MAQRPRLFLFMASDAYNAGQSNVQGAYNTGKQAVDSFDPNAIASQTQQGYNDLFKNQQGEQNNYISAYKNAIASNPQVTDLYNKANTIYNVPTLQNNATRLQNAVLETPNNVLNAAKGFNFDQNQVNNQTNMMLSRLSPQATAATNAANTAEGLAQGYVNAGVQQNQFNLLPVQQQGQMLSDLWARQASGFTTAAQQRYEGLLNKMQSGVALSQSEMQELSKLASSEMDYQKSIYDTQVKAQNQILPQGATYLNPVTKNVYNPFAQPLKP